MTDNNRDSFIEINDVLIPNHLAENTFFVENFIKNRFLNPYYKAFHLFITVEIPKDYPNLHPQYNKAILLLDEEDQIITDVLIDLYEQKIFEESNNASISQTHIEQLEYGYNLILTKLSDY